MESTKKIELVNLDVNDMSVKDRKAFSMLYSKILKSGENKTVIVPLTVDDEQKQVCSFEQVCLCFIALEKACEHALSLDLFEQIDTDGNKFYSVVIAFSSISSSLDTDNFSVREPKECEKKRTNKKTEATEATEATAEATEATAEATEIDIHADNLKIASDIYTSLAKAKCLAKNVDTKKVTDCIYAIIDKYFA